MWLRRSFWISAGVPATTTVPPASPPSGPISITWSAARMMSSWCSMTSTVWPSSTSRCNTSKSLATSSSARRGVPRRPPGSRSPRPSRPPSLGATAPSWRLSPRPRRRLLRRRPHRRRSAKSPKTQRPRRPRPDPAPKRARRPWRRRSPTACAAAPSQSQSQRQRHPLSDDALASHHPRDPGEGARPSSSRPRDEKSPVLGKRRCPDSRVRSRPRKWAC